MYKFLLLSCLFFVACVNENTEKYDLLIVGGGTSGVSAGISASRLGSKTLIIEETDWLGGMLTSAGVSAVDGNYNLPSGIWGEFKDSLVSHYGHLDSLKTGWVSNVQFEPSVGNSIFKNMVSNQKNLDVVYGCTFKNIESKGGDWIVTVTDRNGVDNIYRSKYVIDATELGDVAKACGVEYDMGMESSKLTNEDIAPVESNGIIQDLTYVAIVKDFGYDVSIPMPEGYDSSIFESCCESSNVKTPLPGEKLWSSREMLNYGRLPNNKYMLNWPIRGNDYYLNLIELSNTERDKALEAAKNHTMCFLYYIQNELGYRNLGLADDEYPTEDKLPFIPYHRESRRIHGKVRFTLNHIVNPYEQSQPLYRTCIAVGDYPVDHHHKRYVGEEKCPVLNFYPVPSYGLPLGVMIPEGVENLIVAEKSISVSNIVNGTTRLQPVVMQLGQAAGILAAIASNERKNISEVSVRDVQNQILSSKGYLLPYLDVPVGDKRFEVFQRIGSTGIMKGIGKNVGWSNQTWFRADDKLVMSDLVGLKEYYGDKLLGLSYGEEEVSLKNAIKLLSSLVNDELNIEQILGLLKDYGYDDVCLNKTILRGQMAILIDRLLDPFNKYAVNYEGRIEK